MSSEKVYEMLWACNFCGTKKSLGKTHRFCPTCGAAQDDEARYFPSDDEKVAVTDHVYYGADLICPSCDTLNSANSQFCQQCGTPLEGAQKAQLLTDDQVIADGQSFRTTGSRNIEQERFAEKMAAAGLQMDGTPKSKGGNNLLKFGCIGLIGLVVVFVALSVFWKRDTNAIVTGHTWTREIEIESYAPRSENAWCDMMPVDAYIASRRSEVRSYRQVPDGEECSTRRTDNGDGTFSERRECRTKYRDEPVYDTKCYYTVNRWGFERTVKVSGESLTERPYWPHTNLRRTGNCIGCEREGSRRDDYIVHFRAGDKDYTCELDESRWASMAIESQWTFQVGVISGQPECNSLEQAS